jgi:excisionase family DNA binding protein
MNTTQSHAADGRTVGPEPRPAVDAELLNAREVGQLLGCSVRHIYRLADSGRMPRPVKLGQLVRWRRAEVLDWVGVGCPAVRSVRGGAR